MSLPHRKTRNGVRIAASFLILSFCVFLAACMQPVLDSRTDSKTPLAAALNQPTPWDEFHDTVQPFLATHCFECHGDENAENDFRLDVLNDEFALEDGGQVLEKALKKLASHKMPPSDEPQPPEAEAVQIVDWLKTYLAGDPTGPINPGRVTLRRLNRAEYNNTIRDLLKIDIRPADAFPADDAGYGFDNNGDVLSLAPVLMEKYLAAAQLAVERAIRTDPIVPPPLERWEAATAEGTIPKSDPKAEFSRARPPGANAPPGAAPARRRAMPLGRLFDTSGEIFVDHDIPADGTYVLRTRAYGTQGSANQERSRVAFLVDGAQVQEPFTIKEELRNTSVYSLEATFLTAGRHRISLALLNGPTLEEVTLAVLNAPPPKTAAELAAEEAAAGNGGRRRRRPPGGPPPSLTGKPTLGVIYFELEGPLETTPDRMPESYRRVMVAEPSPTETKRQAAEKIIQTFASRAYRRPVSDEEVGQLLNLWAKTDSDGRPFVESIDVALQAVLVSPAFLFRMELEPQPGESDNVHTLNEYELATRLSYFLWSSMPDDELFGLAEQGKLRANLTAQVNRMLADPKATALVENFAGQWLQLRSMQNVTPDPAQFPDFDPALRAAMTQETELFFQAIVQEDRDVLDFIDADFTYVNGRLAKHYGMTDITGEDFQRVTLAESQRGGLLTQASILTITSYPGRTSPVQRGKWVLENLFDAAPPPPPPNVPALADEVGAELTGTLRQRMEQHRENPSCASCHDEMDGIGFALENFDAVGAWRTRDGDEIIDATGSLSGGRSFTGPVELKQIIRSQSDEFIRCLSSKMLTFALGRGLEAFDYRTIDGITASMLQNENNFSGMIEAIVRSEPFQKRKGKSKRGDV